MEAYIPITWLNDFIFCPYSIYLHNTYASTHSDQYQSSSQTKGLQAHHSIDANAYSTKADDVVGIDVYCEQYNLVGKIDIYHRDKKTLIERKRKIKVIYDGYRYQLYAQYFALIEMGYSVEKIGFYSKMDNRRHMVDLPQGEWLQKFESTLQALLDYDPMKAIANINPQKCQYCIYRHLCDQTSYLED